MILQNVLCLKLHKICLNPIPSPYYFILALLILMYAMMHYVDA